MHLTEVQGKVDLGIITIRQDEFEAVLERFPDEVGRVLGRRQYNLRRLPLPGGGAYLVAVVRCIEQGNGDAQSAAHDLLEDLKPHWLLVAGIAGGVPSEEFGLGDVIVSTRIHDFSVEAVLQGGGSEYALAGGPVEKDAAALAANLPALKKDLGDWASAGKLGVPRPAVPVTGEALYGDEAWRSRVRKALACHAPRQHPVVVSGAIASSDRFIKDADLLAVWMKVTRQVLALEMESAGVYRATYGRQVPTLSIRGISDVVGLQREQAWTTYACHAAASFTAALLRTRPFEPGSHQGREAREQQLRALVAQWPFPRLQDVDPYHLMGVTDSAIARRYVPQDARPPYVMRDVDSELDKALTLGDLVLLVGHSKSGKSRTAFEAALRLYPQHPLIIPSDRDALARLFRLEPPLEWSPAPAVVWLDDLDRFLGPGGLTVSVLNSLSHERGRVKLLATLTAKRHEEYFRSSSDVDKDIQLLLRRFREVRLVSELNPSETQRALALYPGEDKQKLARGLGEHFVAARELRNKYDTGRATCAQGHALVRVAIDWRRAGLTRPIPESALRKLTARYIHILGLPDVDLTEDSFQEGLKWARAPLGLRTALLSKVGDDGAEKHFEAFDYLVDHLDRTGVELPEEAWTLILGFASAQEALAVGVSAYRRQNLGMLRKALEQAIQSNEPDVVLRAVYVLGAIHQEAGLLSEAESAFRQTLSSAEGDIAAWSRVSLGHILQFRGETEEAERLYREAMASSEPDPAAAAVLNLGLLLQSRGELAEAERHYRLALGSKHPESSAVAANNLGMLLTLQGSWAEAERLLRQAIDSKYATASARGIQNLAKLFMDRDELDKAEQLCRDLAHSDDPGDAMMAIAVLGKVQYLRGNLAEAERLYLQAIDSQQPEAVALATISLGQLHFQRGERTQAEQRFRQTIELRQMVSDAARVFLGALFQEQGDLTQAEQLYRPMLSSTDPFAAAWAAYYQGTLMENRQELAEARRLFQRAIDSRQTDIVPMALCSLGSLLQDEGAHDSAIALFRQALTYKNSDDAPRAHLFLGISLAEQKAFEEAEQHYRTAASSDADYTALATGAIGEIYEKRGRLAEAEQLYRTALSTENKTVKGAMQVQLGRLLLRKGETDEGTRLLRDAAGSDDPDVVKRARAVLTRATRAGKPPRG